MKRHDKREIGCVTKDQLPSQLILAAQPTLNEEIEDMTCGENKEDDVMLIITIIYIWVNTPFKKVSVVITEDDE